MDTATTHPTTYVEQADNGHWYEVDYTDGVLSRCRLTGPTDTTASERHDYDPKCGLCWLGYGHSADYHRSQQ